MQCTKELKKYLELSISKKSLYMDSSHTRPESRKKKRNSIRDEKEKESTLREDFSRY
jgi:hypothetical protein